MGKLKQIRLYLKKYEILIASTAVIIIIVISTAIYLTPNFTKISQMITKESSLQKKLERLEEKDKQLTALDVQFYKDNYPKISQIISESKDFVSLFVALDALENTSGVSIVRADFPLGVVSTPSASRKTQTSAFKPYSIPILVEIKGTPDSIIKFIKSTYDLSGRLIVFDDIRLIARTDNTVRTVLNGNAFYYPPATTIGGVDTLLQKMSDQQQKIFETIAQKVNLPTSETEEEIEYGKRNLFK